MSDFASCYKTYSDQLTSLAKTMSDSLFAEASSGNCAMLRRKKKIDEANANGLGDNPIRYSAARTFLKALQSHSILRAVCFPAL
jgi:hypothetical protein